MKVITMPQEKHKSTLKAKGKDTNETPRTGVEDEMAVK
jgi:hypothetical protein